MSRLSARLRRPSYADVASTLALLLALGGSAYAATTLAANSVGSEQIKTDAVGSSEIRSAAVGHAELASNAVTSGNVAADSLTLADMLGASVTGKLSFSIGTWDCWPITINVAGARNGQIAVFSFTAPPNAIPEGIASTQPTVSDGKVALQFCNADTTETSPIEVEDVPFRIATFG